MWWRESEKTLEFEWDLNEALRLDTVNHAPAIAARYSCRIAECGYYSIMTSETRHVRRIISFQIDWACRGRGPVWCLVRNRIAIAARHVAGLPYFAENNNSWLWVLVYNKLVAALTKIEATWLVHGQCIRDSCEIFLYSFYGHMHALFRWLCSFRAQWFMPVLLWWSSDGLCPFFFIFITIWSLQLGCCE